MELLTKLGVDWKLLIAQIVNFLILLFVLYKFVYRPVLDILEKRSKTIEKGLHDAQEAEKRLLEIDKLHEQRMKETQHQVGKLLEAARADAEQMKIEIMNTATTQADDLLKRTRLQIAEEKEKLLIDVKSETIAFVLKLSAKILEREFSPADQKRLADAITHEMKTV